MRRPNGALDLAGVYLERRQAKKNERSGLASNVTVRIKEITGLLDDDGNLQTVKEKLVHVAAAFEKFKESHLDYWSEVKDADGIEECRDYLSRHEDNFSAFLRQVDDWIAIVEHRLLSAALQTDSEIKPEDSVSSAGSHVRSGTSKHSKSSSRASSLRSHANSVETARLKEAARFAELEAEKVMLEKRQDLDEKKFCLSQEEARLNLRAEIAKSAAKGQVLATMAIAPSQPPLHPPMVKPNRESGKVDS